MTVLLPRDENASRNSGAPKAAKAGKDGKVTSSNAKTLNPERDIDVPVIAAASASQASQLAKAPKRVFIKTCLLYTSPSPRDRTRSRMPSSA